jgi:hypothetical protein
MEKSMTEKKLSSAGTKKSEMKVLEDKDAKVAKEEVKAPEKKQPVTLEDMKKDPETQTNMRNLAAQIDSYFRPGKWIKYSDYFKFNKVPNEIFLQVAHMMREFEHAAIRSNERTGEVMFKIDFNKSTELLLIKDDIAMHESEIIRLKERKVVVEKLAKQFEKDKKKAEKERDLKNEEELKKAKAVEPKKAKVEKK